MKDFNHISAKSVEEAIRVLKHYGRKAVINAGGTDLLGVLKDRILPDYPDVVVDIKGISDLNYITEEPEELKIGSCTRLTDIVESENVNRIHPILAKAAQAVVTPQIRNMATLGGNLCQHVRCWYYRYPDHVGGRMMCFRKGGKGCFAVKGDNRYHAILGATKCFAVCPSDVAVALTALDAQIGIAGASESKVVPIRAFYQPMGTILKVGEMITDIRIPKASNRTQQVFEKFTLRKPVDFAIVSVACVVRLDGPVCKEARVVLGAVAPTPIRATKAEEAVEGKVVDESVASEAAEAVLAGAKPLSRNRYKISITKALIKKTLLETIG